MIWKAAALALAWAAVLDGAHAAPASRPAITGVSHLAVYSTDAAASQHFYEDILGAKKGADPETPRGVRYYFSPQQFVEVLPAPPGHGLSMLAHVAYNTADAAALRSYLAADGSRPGELHRGADGAWFSVDDPEGNEVQFIQPATTDATAEPGAVSGRIIHVGFMVHDRGKQDAFYRQLLGFRPYWYGAMKAGTLDWVSQQTPDGPDWLEYMLVGSGSTTPLDHVDANELGVLNHLSLGVPNMEAAVTKLIAEGRLSPRHDGPQMGKDGKWQANLYDPDGTRVELMEFQPVTKPCCSPFTAASPTR
jgi:catechol 2,3-dioxygenase-like lactoylglutathione lyase family enzyme